MMNEWTQFVSFMIAPAGALIFAGIMLYVTRQDRRDAARKQSPR